MPAPELAFTNQAAHYQQMMLHQAGKAELEQVLSVWAGAGEAVQQLTDAEFQSRMSEANAEIVKAMPHLRDTKRFDAFTRRVEAGAKHYGFTDAEIKATADPRMRQMAYDAAYGREARANAAKAKSKVQSAAPMLPVQRAQTPNSSVDAKRKAAFTSLKSSGDIDAAGAYFATFES
jgi:hypothetical protein